MTLRITASNNYGQFDEIHVTQVEKLADDLRLYEIDKPEGNWPTIRHYRSDGWLILMEKVIAILIKGRTDLQEFQTAFEGGWGLGE